MASQPVFTHTEPDLRPILDELRRRELIFHTPEFGTTTPDFERMMAPDYWEVGGLRPPLQPRLHPSLDVRRSPN